jgi:hypothetical protein
MDPYLENHWRDVHHNLITFIQGALNTQLPDLQPLMEQCYRNGRYGATINYKLELDPPLAGEDGKWADEMLRLAGKR